MITPERLVRVYADRVTYRLFPVGTIFQSRHCAEETYVLLEATDYFGRAQLFNPRNASIWQFGPQSGITNLSRLEAVIHGGEE